MSSSFTKMPGFALGRTIPSEMVQLTSSVGALRGRSPGSFGNLGDARLLSKRSKRGFRAGTFTIPKYLPDQGGSLMSEEKGEVSTKASEIQSEHF